MLFKIMVKKVTFVGLRGGHRPSRPHPLDPPLITIALNQKVSITVIITQNSAINYIQLTHKKD